MSYLPFAIAAQLLNSMAVTVDKFLLTKTIPDPLIYIFYFSLISLLAVLAIPFVPSPTTPVLILASISTLSWTAGAYLMFKVLKQGQVQRVIPIIGALTPIFLLILAFQSLSILQIAATSVLIVGLLFLTIQDLTGKFDKQELIWEMTSALFFAFSYYLLSLAFKEQSFLTVLIWSKPILIPLGIGLFSVPSLRQKIISFLTPGTTKPGPGMMIFIFGQISAAASELLLTFSISLANPAIVNSLQGLKYVFLLIFSLILGKKYPQIFKSNFQGIYGVIQILGVILIGTGLYLLAMST